MEQTEHSMDAMPALGEFQAFTPEQVAVTLNTSIDHVWRLIRDRQLFATDITRDSRRKPDRRSRPTWRIPAWSLREFLSGDPKPKTTAERKPRRSPNPRPPVKRV